MGRPGPQGLNPGEPIRYAVELKVDGVAVSLRYQSGASSSWERPGATAYPGDDVTSTTSGPSEASRSPWGEGPPAILEVRGEVYMTNAELVRLNEQRVAAEETPFANPRNATAGSLKLLDPRLCALDGSGSSPTAWARPGGSTTGSYVEILERI